MKLINQVIVITGGTSGVGYQMVKTLQRQNRVLVISRQSKKLAKLKQDFSMVEVYPADLACTEEYKRVADAIVEAHGHIDVLINNAAVQNTPTILDENFDYDEISPEINLNFNAVCALSYLLLPALLKSKNNARIVNINSGLGLAPKTNSAVYCATKAAMNVFSRSLGYQLEGTNISVLQAFLPLVDTPMTYGRGSGKMTAENAAANIISGIEQNLAVNDIGKMKLLRLLLRITPSIAFNMMKKY